MAVQSDGSIVVGYPYTSAPPTLCRLLPTGTIDPAFNPGLNNSVYDIVIGSNDDICALGSFTTDVSEYASGIVRYSASPHLSLMVTGTVPTSSATAGTPITLYGSASTSTGSVASVDFLYSTDGITYLPASAGSPFGTDQWTGVWAPPAAGTYYLRLAASDSSTLKSAAYSISASVLPIPTGAPTYYPNWWFSRGIILRTDSTVTSPVWPTNYPAADDYSAINQGQLKNLALQAYHELTSVLPLSAWATPQGQTLTTMIQRLESERGRCLRGR
jgi:hypothetical protein